MIASVLLLLTVALAQNSSAVQPRAASTSLPIKTTYDTTADKTTVRLAPVQIAGENSKYHSLFMSPSFSYTGHTAKQPDIVDFELTTVVKGRLRTDLYVVFVIDGETIHLSSSRWAIKRPIPGRVWMGERLVFRMPYEMFLKITKARAVEIRFDAVKFPLSENHFEALRDLQTHMK